MTSHNASGFHDQNARSGIDQSELGIKELALLVWEQRLPIGAIILACVFVAVLYVYSATPVYQVECLVQIEGEKEAKGNPLGEMAQMFEVASPAETEIELIRSRMVLGGVIRRLNYDVRVWPEEHGFVQRLMHRPKPRAVVSRFEVPEDLIGVEFELEVRENGAIKMSRSGVAIGEGGVGIPFTSQVGSKSVLLQVDSADASQYHLIKVDPMTATRSLRDNLQASEVGKQTGLIRITYQGNDPRDAAHVLNEVAEGYLHQNLDRSSAEAAKTLQFLEEQLPIIKARLEDSEDRLNEVRSRMGSIDLPSEAKLAVDLQVEVKQRLLELSQKRKELLQLFRPDHPSISTIDSAIAQYKRQETRQELQVKSLPLQQQEILRLMREAEANSSLYTNLLNNAQQLRVIKAGEIGNARIVDPAVPSWTPIAPKRIPILVLSIVLGALFGFGYALTSRLLGNAGDEARMLGAFLGLPVLASIPHSAIQRKLGKTKPPGILALASPDEPAIEAFRDLRTSIFFPSTPARNNTVLVAGTSSQDGKSFVCTNLAVTVCMAGVKVLLIDGDMRRGYLHDCFDQEPAPGLSDLLLDSNTHGCLRSTDVEGLTFLPKGRQVSNPSELLSQKAFPMFLERVREVYDYIIFDAPPVLAVTDSAIIAKQAGTTLVIIKPGENQRMELSVCVARLRQAGAEIRGMVLNDILNRKANQLGYPYGSYAVKS